MQGFEYSGMIIVNKSKIAVHTSFGTYIGTSTANVKLRQPKDLNSLGLTL